MADFTGDGYADLVLHMVSGEMFIGSAPNVTGGVSAGLAFGPIAQTGALGAAAFAVGDFWGDEQQEIAIFSPGPGGLGLVLTVYTVAPDSLTIAAANSVALPIPDASARSHVPRLAADRSGSTLHDQLILSYVQTPQSSQGLTAKLVLIDLNASLQPTVKVTYDLAVPYTFNLLRSGWLN
jgi:hypothetical protein